ncbi:hypothetical protein ACFYE9_32680 [Rhizobium leguminosarum]|uniref:Uncharacterized protein n=1 Tax=Rhizobium leguminosarum TaxID=384 RepID=A0ACD5FE23_RHILE|nr:hypothetical protein [Rhizobium leguminosarum]
MTVLTALLADLAAFRPRSNQLGNLGMQEGDCLFVVHSAPQSPHPGHKAAKYYLLPIQLL